MNIRLKVINRSDSGHRPEIILFQKDVLARLDELSLAWKVIRNCGRDCYHPIDYPTEFEVAVSDSNGNYSPRMQVANGQALTVTFQASGPVEVDLTTEDANGTVTEATRYLDIGLPDGTVSEGKT